MHAFASAELRLSQSPTENEDNLGWLVGWLEGPSLRSFFRLAALDTHTRTLLASFPSSPPVPKSLLSLLRETRFTTYVRIH